MSKREWLVLGSIAGLVLAGLAIEPDHTEMSGHAHGDGMVAGATTAGQTVMLAITGMT